MADEFVRFGAEMLTPLIRKAERNNPRNPGDYEDSDGILHCGVCGEPKRARFDFSAKKDGSWVRVVPVMCECGRRRKAAEEAEEAAEKLKRMREYGGISAELTFQAAKKSAEMDKCWKYAENWDKAVESNVGLLLWGDVGTGKTFAAHCVCNALLARNPPVCAFVTSLSYVLNSGWDKSETVSRVRYAPLVVFDDLGAERSSEYALENVFSLVDERYRARKPLIVTSNLTLDEMRVPQDIRRKRIYDRILEMCVPIEFKGASRRGAVSAGKLQFARETLGL